MRRALVAVLLAAAVASARADPPPMPRGSHADGDRVRSALGFRATVEHFERRFTTDGLAVRRIGPYQIGGVDVVRFVATAPHPPWLAVHVYRVAGVTWIFVVAAPLDAAKATE